MYMYNIRAGALSHSVIVVCGPWSHPEIGRVHSELGGVLLAELLQAGGHVVDLAHGQSDSAHHFLPVFLHGSGAGTQVRPVGEVGLGSWVDDEHPAGAERTL